MATSDQEYLHGLREHISETRDLFTNRNKPERERMVARAFLRCIGVKFTDEEIQAADEEPLDTIFRDARFQVMEIVGDRRRGDDLRDTQRRYEAATSISDVMEPFSPSVPISLTEMSERIAGGLSAKAAKYGSAGCSTLDALVYVDLIHRHLWPVDVGISEDALSILDCHGWRSVSMLFVPFGMVLRANAFAPQFLNQRVGRVLSECHDPDGLFDASAET